MVAAVIAPAAVTGGVALGALGDGCVGRVIPPDSDESALRTSIFATLRLFAQLLPHRRSI
jgi:hypothetical protein